MTSLTASKPTKEVYMTIPQVCKVPECDSSHRIRNGYCNRHYLQVKRTGGVQLKTNRDERKAVYLDGEWKIPLGTNAKDGYALVDKEFAWLEQYKWYKSCGYAVSKIDGKMKKMHRLIASAEPGEHVDHRNRDTLDNRAINLRRCTSSQNIANSGLSKNNTTGFKGVVLVQGKYYSARVKYKRKDLYAGTFKNPIDAARAYDKLLLACFGEYALTNKKMGLYDE